MACGLRRCSGKRGCICPRTRSSSAFAGCVVTSSPLSAPRLAATEDDSDSKATPEDVTKLFKWFDIDGNGMIDRKELADVLSSLDSTYWTMKRIRALVRAADLDRDQFISWQEFCKWIFAPGNEQQLVRSAVPVLEARQTAADAEKASIREMRSMHEASLAASETIPALAAALTSAEAALAPYFGVDELQEHRQRLARMQAEAEKTAIRELRSKHEASLAASETIPALAAALKSAEAALAPHIGVDELQEHRQRLEKMHLPFDIVVTTLAQGEFRLEVTRQLRVSSLCQELAKLVDKKAYRISLAHEGGRLKPSWSTLEECGVKGPMPIAAQFGEADPLMELSLSEFLALLVEHKLASQREIEAWQQECGTGKKSDDDIRHKFKHRLNEEIAIRRRKVEEEEKQRKAWEDRKLAILDTHRAELVALPFDVLLSQALKAQIVHEVEAVPEDHRDSLLQELALTSAVKACEADRIVLDHQLHDEEAVCQKLANEAQAIKDPAEALLAESMPQYFEAMKAVETLRKADTAELRHMTRPPGPLLKTIEILVLMFHPSARTIDYLMVAQKQLLDLIDKGLLYEYDKDNIPDKVIRRMKSYIEDETCSAAEVAKHSKAGSVLCTWIRAIYVYNSVAKEVEPYKIALRQKEAELADATSQLKMHQQDLSQVMEDLQYFQSKLVSLQEGKKVLRCV